MEDGSWGQYKTYQYLLGKVSTATSVVGSLHKKAYQYLLGKVSTAILEVASVSVLTYQYLLGKVSTQRTKVEQQELQQLVSISIR